jgi:NAD(P)-dependent dehydrogenase (short-subunit alcohol dehydrogenase family)
MLTVQLAWELRDTPIKVSTVNPGYTATDMNDNRGTQTVEEGAAEIVRQCLVPDDAPTGGFFETGALFRGRFWIGLTRAFWCQCQIELAVGVVIWRVDHRITRAG